MSIAPLGLFGGTFDPVHFGHLRMAQELADALDLNEVRFIPAGRPPHREAPGVSAAQRLEMVRLAIAGNPRFTLDEREIRKATPCYSVETLSELRQELGTERPLCLLMGADAFLGLPTWHRWRELFDLAHIVVAHRPGFPQLAWADSMPQALKGELEQRQQAVPQALGQTPAGGIATVPITALDISATYIRQSVRAGKSPRYLVPDSVLQYIQINALYL